MCVLSVSIYFFQTSETNKFLTPAESRALNKPCVLFDYWSNHDVWHLLSALGTCLMFLGVFCLDDDVRHMPRARLAVF